MALNSFFMFPFVLFIDIFAIIPKCGK